MDILKRTSLTLTLILVAGPLPHAFAEVDLSGSWQARNQQDAMQRGPGPYPVDYTGLPLNQEGRANALSFSQSTLSTIEHQCAYYQPTYVLFGPQGLRIWTETDAVNGTTVAIKIGAANDRAPITIWMDGRPHPSKNAPHLIGGFTTGSWEGDVLVFYTTHMKSGYIRRNGAPASDETALTGYLSRHGDILTMLGIIEDPIYLSEPLLITRTFQLVTRAIRPLDTPCIRGYEGGPSEGSVAQYLPGQNPFIGELTNLYHIPREAVLGGAETMYPDYRKKLKSDFVRPDKCTLNCGGPGRGGLGAAVAAPAAAPGR